MFGRVLSSLIKESLTEYGSGWEWERDTYAHAFDQANTEGIPYRLSDYGKSFDTGKDFCKDEIETTAGQILMSGSTYLSQKSCGPNVYNAGNYYSWPAVMAGGVVRGDILSSICPKSWIVPTQYGINPDKSMENLVSYVYPKDASNAMLAPFSFGFTGRLYNYLDVRGECGLYYLSHITNTGYPQYFNLFSSSYSFEIGAHGYGASAGLSLRCGGFLSVTAKV